MLRLSLGGIVFHPKMKHRNGGEHLMDNAHRTVQTFTPLQADNILGALVPSSVAAIASARWLQIGIGKRFGSVVDFKSECFDLMICHYFE